MALVQMDLKQIIIKETSDAQHIVLKERGGARQFPIVIGIYEATAIDRGVKQIRAPRPLTHDLLQGAIHRLDAHLERVVINDLRDGIFFAKLELVKDNGERVDVDSRPSDAIALAVLERAPIFVEEAVLKEVSSIQTPL